MSHPKSAIIGYGTVGKHVHRLFPQSLVHDPFVALPKSATIEEINHACECVFICMPTPFDAVKNRLDTDEIKETIANLKVKLVIVRSTMNPGDGDTMQRDDQEVVVWPEYLGETVGHPMNQSPQPAFVVLGGTPTGRRSALNVLQHCFNASVRIRQVSHTVAEIIKLSENRSIAWRVHECQELYDACEAAGVDYYEVREAVYGDDPRMNLWWSFVYPEHRGFQSKCIPKDVYAWISWTQSNAFAATATDEILKANETLLNPRRDIK
jgi:UDPglucose 6-dehydrogenase